MSGILTIADLVRITGKPSHSINYAIRRCGPKPAGRVGIARVWESSQLPEIEAAIEKTALKTGQEELATT